MRTGLVILAWAVASLAQGSAFAQTSSLFGSSGPRAQSSGSASTSASGQGGTGSSGATGSMSATGNRSSGGGAGGGGAGGGGAIQQPQLNQLGQLSSQAVGNGTGFVGLTNQAFVGNRMAGTGGTSMMQPSFGALGGGRGGSDFNNQNGGSQGSASSRPFRPQYRVGFEYRPPSGDVARRAELQADRLRASNPALSGLQIDVNDQGIAEIRGEAPTQDARMLIENLVRLEPGIREVTNLVEVVPTPPTATNP